MAYKYPLVGDLIKKMDQGGAVHVTGNPAHATGTERARYVPHEPARGQALPTPGPTILGSPRRGKK
jgi:hypothetical protein